MDAPKFEELPSAIINVHNLIIRSPALRRALLEHADRVLVATSEEINRQLVSVNEQECEHTGGYYNATRSSRFRT